MRENWDRQGAEIAVDRAAISALLQPAFSRPVDISRIDRVSGGLVNTNIKVTLSDDEAAVLLRIYQRGAKEGLKEAAILRRLAGHVPVPELLFAAEHNPITGHAYSILRWIEGRSLDGLARAGEELASAARGLGEALANVHAMKFQRFGYLNPELNIQDRIDFDRAGLLAYLDNFLVGGVGPDRLGRDLLAAIRRLVERQGDRIASWPGAPCLVHGDCNGSNLIVARTRAGQWELAAMLDWEFAFSGAPGFDFAHFLRPPLDVHAAFGDVAAASYRAAGGMLPANWRAIARFTDLFAWIDIVARADSSDQLTADARDAIARIVSEQMAGQ